MKKPKINIDRPKMTEAELAARKNFDAVLKGFKSAPPVKLPKPFYKTGWFLSTSAIAVTSIGLIWYGMKGENKSSVPVTEPKTKEIVTVETIKEIEKHDPLPITEKAVDYSNLKNASEPLKKVDAPITAQPELKLDTIATPPIEPLSNTKEDRLKLSDEIKKIEQLIEETKKLEPVKPKTRGYRFKLDIVPDEFPKLANYTNLLWELGPEKENEGFTPAMLKKEWDEGKIKVFNRDVNYKLTLRKGDIKYTYIIYPVTKDNEYDKYVKEQAIHNKKMDSLSSIKSLLEKQYNGKH